MEVDLGAEEAADADADMGDRGRTLPWTSHSTSLIRL
jgi:hypothetical protein